MLTMDPRGRYRQPSVANVGVYVRLSEDRDGTSTSPRRQADDCRALCAAKGWTVARVFEDVDLSAFRHVRRPAFEEMCADLTAGRIDGIVCWKLDRLARNRRDYSRLAELVESTGAILAAVNDPIDTTTDMGWFVVDMLAGMARMEAANTGTRVRRAIAESAQAGKPHKSGRRPFGLAKDWTAIEPGEAHLIRDAAARVLAGASVNSITREWNADGVTTTSGNVWRAYSLRRLLMSPHTAALRVHDGRTYEGDWPAIVDRSTHERLKQVLGDPSRRVGGGGRATYLLSGGLLRCALCDAPMMARPREDRRRRYVCRPEEGVRGCGHVGIVAAPLEEYVRDLVLAAVDGPALRAAQEAEGDGEHDGLAAQLDEYQAALEELSRDYYVDRAVTRAQFQTASRELLVAVDRTKRALGRLDRPAVLTDLPDTVEELRAAWDAEGRDWRRQLLDAVLDAVRVSRGRRGLNRFDPGRVELVWRA